MSGADAESYLVRSKRCLFERCASVLVSRLLLVLQRTNIPWQQPLDKRMCSACCPSYSCGTDRQSFAVLGFKGFCASRLAACCTFHHRLCLIVPIAPPPLFDLRACGTALTPPALRRTPCAPPPLYGRHVYTHTRARARAQRWADQILPGMVLQSDQLSTAVDNGRRLLQLPRRPGGDTGEGDKDELSLDHDQQHRRYSSAALKRASERLLLRFVAGGGGQGGQRSRAIVPRSGKGEKWSRLLSLGADLRGSRAKGDSLPPKKVFQSR